MKLSFSAVKPRLTLLILLALTLPFLFGFGPFRFQATPPADPLLALLILLYGFGVSWAADRFGTFEKLSPSVKQLVIALVGFVVPLVVGFFTKAFGTWPDAIGTPESFVTALLMLLAPVAVWLMTQIAHYFDLALARLAGKR